MVYKIIKTDDYLLVLGKNYKSDSFPYLVAEKLTTGNYQLWQVDNPNDVDEPNQFEILAHLPLNGSPILEGVPLLPPIEDNVEEIAESMLPEKGTFHRKWVKMGIIAGYNKAKKKYKYTEEDMIEFAIWRNHTVFDSPYTPLGEFRLWESSIKQYPTEFETMDEYPVITDDDYFLKEEKSISKPKTITTTQGIQWVGKYK